MSSVVVLATKEYAGEGVVYPLGMSGNKLPINEPNAI